MKKVAFLLADQFEDSEMKVPYDAVKNAGHEVDIIGLTAGAIVKGKQGKEEYSIEKAILDVHADDYDAVVIPGGSSPENLRLNKQIQQFVMKLDEAKKPVAAICHGPQILISAGLVKGRTLTSYPPLQDDLINAGALYEDREVIVDNNFITSRAPNDEPEFVREILKAL